MKTTFVSTYSQASNLRAALPKIQSELAKAATEVSTSRHADIGLTLGRETSRTLSLRHEFAAIEAYVDSNAITAGQLQRTQVALQSLLDGANSYLQDLVSSPDPSGTVTQLTDSAQHNLEVFQQLVNSSGDGQQLFGGINSGVPPLADYETTQKLAIDTAFSTFFGIAMPNPQDDPAVGSITAADMKTFLEGDYAALFEDPAWTTNWSSASSTNTTSSISPSEEVESSVNANEPALRKLAMAYSMMADLGGANLSDEALEVVAQKSREAVGEAIFYLGNMQSRVGFAEARIESATQRIKLEKDVIQTNINTLEGVDPIDAKVRFDSLTTQLEMSYALTSKILSLSMINYA
ncbi:flagellar hook-associated family protein [Afifella sp. IM 167]|uniref:flagellar hook-associated family protein n=1 Tax=Afifella sp. IM 167 TaxID=2033586 RepID=UPI001CCFCCC1|nr:flagellar hook-associated family protein [Afifella sp. IM 167]MBZ8131799.1 hypothetical protein [Afifella sp. IM 167]